MSLKRYVLAITGATGPIVGLRVLRELSRNSEVHVIISETSFSIIREETGIDWTGADEAGVQDKIRAFAGSDNIHFYADRNFHAPVASGSFSTDGMFVAPCSMKTLAGIACGYANGLVERAADVTLKEGRPLVLSPRETPFSAIHLENMLKLSRIGVRIVPPVIGFYHRPGGLDDVIDFIAGKILDSMGVEHRLFRRWGE